MNEDDELEETFSPETPKEEPTVQQPQLSSSLASFLSSIERAQITHPDSRYGNVSRAFTEQRSVDEIIPSFPIYLPPSPTKRNPYVVNKHKLHIEDGKSAFEAPSHEMGKRLGKSCAEKPHSPPRPNRINTNVSPTTPTVPLSPVYHAEKNKIIIPKPKVSQSALHTLLLQLPSKIIEYVLEFTIFVMPQNFFDMVDTQRPNSTLGLWKNKTYFANLYDDLLQMEKEDEASMPSFLQVLATEDKSSCDPIARSLLIKMLYGYAASDSTRRVFMVFKNIEIIDRHWVYNLDLIKFKDLRGLGYRERIPKTSSMSKYIERESQFFDCTLDRLATQNPSLVSVFSDLKFDYDFSSKYSEPIIQCYKSIDTMDQEIAKPGSTLSWVKTLRNFKALKLSCMDIVEGMDDESLASTVESSVASSEAEAITDEITGNLFSILLYPGQKEGKFSPKLQDMNACYPGMTRLKLRWIEMNFMRLPFLFPNLTSLSLEPFVDDCIDEKIQKVLFEGSSFKLRKLSLSGIDLSDTAQTYLAMNTHLQKLSLVSCSGVKNKLIAKAPCLKRLKIESAEGDCSYFLQMPMLEELKLDKSLNYKALNLLSINKKLRKLEIPGKFSLKKHECSTPRSYFALEKISHCTSLQSLAIFGGAITKESFTRLHNMNNLHTLKLYHVDKLEDDALLPFLKHPSLYSLTVTSCKNITDKSIIPIAMYLRTLGKLFLANVGISSKAVGAIMNNRNLIRVFLKGVRILHVSEDLNGLASSASLIRELYLKDTVIPQPLQLIEVLKLNKSLSTFHFTVPRNGDIKQFYREFGSKIKDLQIDCEDKRYHERTITIRDLYLYVNTNEEILRRHQEKYKAKQQERRTSLLEDDEDESDITESPTPQTLKGWTSPRTD